jgi:UbiA prenyltransferase family
MLLVRPRAWWYNKVPLSVLTLLLLVDGDHLSFRVCVALIGLMGCVCGVGNYGYALNELFDRDEDLRAGRSNAAHTATNRKMWSIIVGSAAFALAAALYSGGLPTLEITMAVLLLPLAYSVPPLRIKERGWSGVLSDALAAHVYPAALALLIVSHQSLRSPSLPLVAAMLCWALATGLRGILSHQLQSEDSDRKAGLSTVVHQIGHRKLVLFTTYVILPIEFAAFSATFLQSAGTLFVKIVALIFVVYELAKFLFDVFPVVVFTRKGQRYLPFVDEGFYKVWGPLAFLLDAAFFDLRYLVAAPLYFLMFRPRILQEWQQMRSASRIIGSRILRFPQTARRSGAGSDISGGH